MEQWQREYERIRFCIRCGNTLENKADREDKIRPHCPHCGWIYYWNPIPACACVHINQQRELLIIKRKFEPKAGSWALPSGYVEIDQTPEECAVSELQEETGLIAEVDHFLDYFTGSSPLYRRIISFGFLMRVTGGRLQAGDDATEACYVALDEIPPIAFAAHRHYIQVALAEIG